MFRKYFLLLFTVSMVNYFTIIVAEDDDKLHLIIDEMKTVQENTDIIKIDVKIESGDDKIVVNGDVEQKLDLDDEYQVKMIVVWSEKEDDPDPLIINLPKMGVCEMMGDLYKSLFYDTIKDYSNAPDPNVCPVPKGNYFIKDYPYDLVLLSNFMSPGFYRLESQLSYNNETVAEYVLRAHVKRG